MAKSANHAHCSYACCSFIKLAVEHPTWALLCCWRFTQSDQNVEGNWFAAHSLEQVLIFILMLILSARFIMKLFKEILLGRALSKGGCSIYKIASLTFASAPVDVKQLDNINTRSQGTPAVLSKHAAHQWQQILILLLFPLVALEHHRLLHWSRDGKSEPASVQHLTLPFRLKSYTLSRHDRCLGNSYTHLCM